MHDILIVSLVIMTFVLGFLVGEIERTIRTIRILKSLEKKIKEREVQDV